MRPQNRGEVEEDEPQERNPPVPCAGPAVPGLGSPWRARVEEQERQSRKKKYKNVKEDRKYPGWEQGRRQQGQAQLRYHVPHQQVTEDGHTPLAFPNSMNSLRGSKQPHWFHSLSWDTQRPARVPEL